MQICKGDSEASAGMVGGILEVAGRTASGNPCWYCALLHVWTAGFPLCQGI